MLLTGLRTYCPFFCLMLKILCFINNLRPHSLIIVEYEEHTLIPIHTYHIHYVRPYSPIITKYGENMLIPFTLIMFAIHFWLFSVKSDECNAGLMGAV